MKKILASVLSVLILFQISSAFAMTSEDFKLYEKAIEFAKRYEYHDEDDEKTMEFYPDIVHAFDISETEDGVLFEYPTFYSDDDAAALNCYDLEKGEMTLITNGNRSQSSDQRVAYNGFTLLPASVFTQLGLTVDFDENFNVATISDGETVLEILPQLTGMRKNQADGFYVPLEACARFVDGVLYVPARAVANEFNISVGWDGGTHTVTLNNNI